LLYRRPQRFTAAPMLRLVFLLAVCAISISRAADKPNIVLIFADDLGN
jgi:hypothetical protein